MLRVEPMEMVTRETKWLGDWKKLWVLPTDLWGGIKLY